MILVTGASGHLGKAVIRNLAKLYPANSICALVRDENKISELRPLGIQIRIGDYDNIESLNLAMKGIEKVLLISGTDEENRISQHLNVINAAKNADVKFIAYTSRFVKDNNTSHNHLMDGHFKTESHIIYSGLDYLIFRNALYFDTIPTFVGGDKVFTIGSISVPAGSGKVSFVLRAELGEAIAKTLVSNELNKEVISLTANRSWSLYDIAEALSELSGQSVTYSPIERSEFVSRMLNLGLPELLANRYADFQEEIKQGVLEDTTTSLERILGRKPTQLKEGIKAVFNVTR